MFKSPRQTRIWLKWATDASVAPCGKICRADVCWRMLTCADVCWRVLTRIWLKWATDAPVAPCEKTYNYYYTCVLTLLYVSSYCYMCPHTTIYVSSYYYICVLILRMHLLHTVARLVEALRIFRLTCCWHTWLAADMLDLLLICFTSCCHALLNLLLTCFTSCWHAETRRQDLLHHLAQVLSLLAFTSTKVQILTLLRLPVSLLRLVRLYPHRRYLLHLLHLYIHYIYIYRCVYIYVYICVYGASVANCGKIVAALRIHTHTHTHTHTCI
jgi:hypothetical protein